MHYAVAPLIFILFCKRYVVRIPVIQQLLCFFGKHSLNIFLIHTFIRFNFFTDFIYSFRYFWLITLVLFGISLGISIVLEWIKKGIRFDIFTHWLCTKNGESRKSNIKQIKKRIKRPVIFQIIGLSVLASFYF